MYSCRCLIFLGVIVFTFQEDEEQVIESNLRNTTSWFRQVCTLTQRSFLNMTRDIGYYWLRIIFYIAVSICIGTLFFHIGTNSNSILARAKCVSFIYGFMICLSCGGLPFFIEELKVNNWSFSLSKGNEILRFESRSSVKLSHLLSHQINPDMSNRNHSCKFITTRHNWHGRISLVTGLPNHSFGNRRSWSLKFMLCYVIYLLTNLRKNQVFYSERSKGHYGEAAFVLSNIISSFPFLLLISLSCGIIIYFMVQFHPGLNSCAFFCINLFCCLSVVESCIMAVAAVVPNMMMGIGVGTGVIVSESLICFLLIYEWIFVRTRWLI